ncbi:hypothetical protein [Brucella cytisi]|uniref:Phage protein n=1 Tax=Brucella cytisi TaxID=407152 RepID=A0A1J6IA75_9HYPH|nr:hypothetical protein [Brucella cytisi]OIS91920.1 hypothetical protein BLA27_18565 [Brucella cytisi]
MFKISFTPQRRDETLTIEKTDGNRLRINGEVFNFDTLNDGDIIPLGEIPCEWIRSPVERKDAVINVTILLPYSVSRIGVEPPEPIVVEDNGLIVLPSLDPDFNEELPDVDA